MVPYANSRFGIIASKTEAEASGIALVKIYLGQRGATDRFWPKADISRRVSSGWRAFEATIGFHDNGCCECAARLF